MAEIISIYESIGRNLRDILVKGTPTNCTATSFQANVLIHPNPEQLRGKEVFWYSGVGAGQARTVGSFNPGSKAIIHNIPYDTVPSSNSKFLIFNNVMTEEYEAAMNRALGLVKLKYLETKSGTLAAVASQYEYAVPSGFEWVSNLRIVPSASNSNYGADNEVSNIFEFPINAWRIERNVGGSYIIVIDPRKVDMNTLDGELLRVIGQVKPDFAGTHLPENVEEFVIAHASMQLAASRVDDGIKWKTLFAMYRDAVQGKQTSPGLEDYIMRYGRGKKVGG